MNLVLLNPDEREGEHFRLRDRRARHIIEIHRAKVGDSLRVGLRGGLTGEARIISLAPDEVVLDATFDTPPPARSIVDLILAVPRPKVLKRILQHATTIGVERIVLVNSARVEKSYFQSPVLSPESIDSALVEGLEQGRDTRPPEVLIRPRFRALLEDEVPLLWPDADLLLAHPAGPRLWTLPQGAHRRRVVAIGPEGGWVPFELEQFERMGFRQASLGDRPLRVEAAMSTLIGAVEAWHAMGD